MLVPANPRRAIRARVAVIPKATEPRQRGVSERMKVLLIGNGAREHALAWKLADSPRVTALYAAPGNPGTAQVAENLPFGAMAFDKIEKFVRENNIGLVVVGPEDPLAAGLADRILAMGVKVFGPIKEAARLEADKWFAKELMRQQSIPTAEARSFNDPKAAEEYVRARNQAVVVKASGLAKGKGVTVCYRPADAITAIDRIMRKKEFGDAGRARGHRRNAVRAGGVGAGIC